MGEITGFMEFDRSDRSVRKCEEPMTIFSKTIRAAELPDAWQKEIGVDSGRLLKIAIEDVTKERSPDEIEALREGLRSIVPVDVEGDVTSFIRSERDRLDGRNGTS